MKPRTAVTCIAIAATMALGGTAVADNSNHPRWKTIHVTTVPTGIVVTPLGHVCDNGGQCVYSQTESDVTQTGDFQGSTVQADVTGASSDPLLTSVSSGTFTGTVTGCGAGAFLYTARGTFDVTSGDSDATYVILPGSGTGELAGITGVLHQHSAATDTASPISGTVRCAARR